MLFFKNTNQPSLLLGSSGVFPFRRDVTLDAYNIARHKHIIGTTGQGKSKFAAHAASSLILSGTPVAVVDPHADLTQDILGILYDNRYFTRPNAYDKLWYIEFSRSDSFIPFNVLSQPYSIHTIGENVFDALTRAWASLSDGAAPRLENIVKASIPVLVANNLPLTRMHDLLTEKAFRDQMLASPQVDIQVVKFFLERFEKWGKDTAQMIESTLTRVFLLSYTPALRYTLGQTENILNFRDILDKRISVLFNLGKLDPNTRRLLGCLITVGFEQATLSRADLLEKDRHPYHIFIDEFSQFTAQSEESFTTFLSEARKFKVSLTLLHQTWSQLSERLQGAMQNTVHIAFALGRSDALWASQIFGRYDPYHVKHKVENADVVDRTHPMFFNIQETFETTARMIEDLKPREALIKLQGKTIKFKTAAVPPAHASYEDIQRLKEFYIQKLAKPLTAIEQEGAAQQQAPQESSRWSKRISA